MCALNIINIYTLKYRYLAIKHKNLTYMVVNKINIKQYININYITTNKYVLYTLVLLVQELKNK